VKKGNLLGVRITNLSRQEETKRNGRSLTVTFRDSTILVTAKAKFLNGNVEEDVEGHVQGCHTEMTEIVSV
jgi:hypothetical protein